MKLYVAGASREIALVESYVHRVREAGAVITYDWCAAMRAETRADHAIPSDELQVYATNDLSGIAHADSFWLLAPEEPSLGCWTELGYALARGRRVVVSGPWQRCIFAHRAEHKFSAHDDALSFLSERVAA